MTSKRRAPREPVLRALVALLKKERNLGSAAPDREDAIMDAIVRVLSWEDDASQVTNMEEHVARSYAVRAVHNQLLDQLKRVRADALLERELADAVSEDSFSTTTSPPMLARCEQLLAEVNPEGQDLLRAHLAGRDFFAEESTRQGLSPSAARVRIHRLLRRLRERGGG